MPTDKYPIDYDGNWKEISSALIDDFIAFFLPEIHPLRDFTQPIVFLEQELQEMLPDTESDKMVDKLLKVSLQNGNEEWILVHIEFQTAAEKDFTARMYHYYQLIRAKYDRQVSALVVYTGKHKPRIYDYYKEQSYTSSLVYRFKTYHIACQNPDELLLNPNPFAIVVLANYYVLKTRHHQKDRLTFKEQLYDCARSRGYDDRHTAQLIAFLNSLMRLNALLQQAFREYISPNLPIHNTMFRYTPDTYELVDAQTQTLYGTTVPEIQQQMEAKQQQAEAKLQKNIVLLYSKFSLSIDEIALQLDETVPVVQHALRTAGVID